ncbi:chemotaxis protein CheW [Sphingomonadaceae bacterium OTU29MARTA1]|uniref:chemotaxis protein CheW n=1 Tax=Sphingomonas sp. Leaf37 TaxID=2876552 RepID=UPI001E41ECDB|nr:chemotaxis protein CheW [Sphingomonas sp. Leaf37]USU06070.1 chemotaxis protein CheW [Sphingomonadaceae bacterium OTU29LAMAA1]USU09554.1 chemotaxis protein CheW [Sphingomonadaceae bacterium OTU29MARTA1]
MDLFLIAHFAGRGVAIDTTQVDSVVDIAEVVQVPRTETAIRGLVALRSRVVTVIDTGTALGLEPTPESARRAVITRVDGHHYAILVDSLEDVALFERQPLSSGLALDRGWQAVGTGLIERDGEPMLIVDLAALVPQQAAAA